MEGQGLSCAGERLVLKAGASSPSPRLQGSLLGKSRGPRTPTASPGDCDAGSSQLNIQRFPFNFQAKHRICCFHEGDWVPLQAALSSTAQS